MSAKRLSLGRIVGFTVGDYAFNLYWQSVSLFLLFFYTDMVGLSAAVAGLIYMIASIFDAAIDPVMGAIADRTRSRWGRYRPYILFGGPFVGLAFMLLYYAPPLTGTALAIWLLAAHIVFRIAYTAASIPYTAMSARITQSSSERGTVAGARIIFATLAGLTIAILTPRLVQGLNSGGQGWLWAAAIFAGIATCVFPLVFLTTSEPPETGLDRMPTSIAGYWKALKDNRALWVMLAGICTGVICSTALGKSVLYYFKYELHAEAAGASALGIVAASGLVIVPAWIWITRLTGKRTAWLIAVAWGLVGLAGFTLAEVRSVAVATAFFVWMHVTSLGLALGFWSLLPDTVEYGEWRSGVRTESFIFGLGAFFLKAALGLGAGLFGWLLEVVGYRANVEQTAETLANMKLLMTALPAIGLTCAGLAMLAYPLRGRMHDDIVREITERRATLRDQP